LSYVENEKDLNTLFPEVREAFGLYVKSAHQFSDTLRWGSLRLALEKKKKRSFGLKKIWV